MQFHVVLASLSVGLVSATVTCPDGGHCPDRNTCCPTQHGYGCCTDTSAVCCPGLRHCCPAGYHCSDATQSCVTHGLTWLRLLWHENALDKESVAPLLKLSHHESDSSRPTVKKKPVDASVVHCDGHHHCPDGTTCCKRLDLSWGCCPHPDAQCCSDRIHCCPHGTFCDSTSKECLSGTSGLHIPATAHRPALRTDDYQGPYCRCPKGYYCDSSLSKCLSLKSGRRIPAFYVTGDPNIPSAHKRGKQQL